MDIELGFRNGGANGLSQIKNLKQQQIIESALSCHTANVDSHVECRLLLTEK